MQKKASQVPVWRRFRILSLTIMTIRAMVAGYRWRFHSVNKFGVVSVLHILVIILVVIGGGP
jgi:hypothetical protein